MALHSILKDEKGIRESIIRVCGDVGRNFDSNEQEAIRLKAVDWKAILRLDRIVVISADRVPGLWLDIDK